MLLDISLSYTADMPWSSPFVHELTGDEAAEARRSFEELEQADQPKRPRGRPRKVKRRSPDSRSFDEIAAAIRAIPDKGPWIRAKEATQRVIDADADLTPAAAKLVRATLRNLNHGDGFDFGGRDHYADLLGYDPSTIRRAWAELRRFGHVLRRRVPRPGTYDLWQITLPVLVDAHITAERDWEAKKSKPGGEIINFSPPGGRPNRLLIPSGVVVGDEGGSARPVFLKSGEEVLEGEVLSSLGDFGSLPTPEQVQELLRQASRHNVSDAMAVERQLRKMVNMALRREQADSIEEAVEAVLGACADITNIGNFIAFIRATFDRALHEAKIARLEQADDIAQLPERKRVAAEAEARILAAKVSTEETIAQRRVAAMDAAVEANSAKRIAHRSASGTRDGEYVDPFRASILRSAEKAQERLRKKQAAAAKGKATLPEIVRQSVEEEEARLRGEGASATIDGACAAQKDDSAADADDVFWVEDCKIEVLKGFKTELEATFPNVDIASGLAIVAGEALPTETGTALKKRIRRKFGYLNNDEKNRDRRASAAAAAQPSNTERRNAMQDRIAKKLFEERNAAAEQIAAKIATNKAMKARLQS